MATGIGNPWQGWRRVVITGLGVIAPNGKELESFWNSVVGGVSSGQRIRRFDPSKLPCQIDAEIDGFNPSDHMDAKMARRLDRSLQFGVAAARLASIDAGLDLGRINPDRIGVIEATSMSNIEAIFSGHAGYSRRGYRSVSPAVMINAYFGGGSGEIAAALGIRAHALSCSSSSASGNDALGYAASMIRHEDVDVMIAGGAEAPLFEEICAGFCVSQAVSRQNDRPKEAMRPFDADRDGFVLGEGAAFLVLEELSHALGRGARIYAELLAHGRSCEAYHPVAPHPDGVGCVRAMEKAFIQAQVHPSEVDYINAHGSATVANDRVETLAIRRFFGRHADRLAVSATKPVTGHPMAAAGAMETVICALAIHRGVIPMTANLATPGEDCDLDYVPGHSRPYPIRVAVNLNSGFGGKNSCLILRQFQMAG